MAKIKTLKNWNEDHTKREPIAPRTHVKAVYDDNGDTLDSLMAVQDEKLSELGSEVDEVGRTLSAESEVNTEYTAGYIDKKGIANSSDYAVYSDFVLLDAKVRYAIYASPKSSWHIGYYTSSDESSFLSSQGLGVNDSEYRLIPLVIPNGAVYVRVTLPKGATAKFYEYVLMDEPVPEFVKMEVGEIGSYNSGYGHSGEYIRAYIDNEGRLLWGITKDGDVVYGKGLPKQVKAIVENRLKELNDKVDKTLNDALYNVVEIGGDSLSGTGYAKEIKHGSSVVYPITRAGNVYSSEGISIETVINELVQLLDGKINNSQGSVSWNNLSSTVQELIKSGGSNEGAAASFIPKVGDLMYFSKDNTTYLQFDIKQSTSASFGFKYDYEDTDMSSFFTSSKTIYYLRFYHDIDSVSIPADSVLVFCGGSLNNGTIIGENTKVISYNKGCLNNCTIDGVWDCDIVDSDWLDFKKDQSFDDNQNFKNLMVLANGINLSKVYIRNGNYYSTIKDNETLMEVPSNTEIINEGIIHKIGGNNSKYTCIGFYNVKNCILRGGVLTGDILYHKDKGEPYYKEYGDHEHGIKVYGSENIEIRDLLSQYWWGDGIDLIDAPAANDYKDNERIRIYNVRCLYNGRQGLSIESAFDLVVRDCEFLHTGEVIRHSPGANIDIEPWHYPNSQKVQNILIENCRLNKNSADTKWTLMLYINSPDYDDVDRQIVFRNCDTGVVRAIGYAKGVLLDNCKIEDAIAGETPYIKANYGLRTTGPTSKRPSYPIPSEGYTYLDTDINKMIYWFDKWVDSNNNEI